MLKASQKPAHYRPDIDGLRAIAVLAVLGFHAEVKGFAGGFAGVDVFFVISGFLITGIILGALEKGTFSFTEFYTRRANRILPALLVVLTATAVTGWVILYSSELKSLGRHITASSFFSSNFLSWLGLGYFESQTKPLLHLWSLAVEEQFYLVWPLGAVFMWRRRVRFTRPLIAVVLISFGFAIIALRQGYGSAAFYFPFSRFWEIGLGALLALHAHTRDDSNRVTPTSEVAALAGAILVAMTFVLVSADTKWPGAAALLPTLGTVLLVWAGHQTRVNRLLSNKALVAIGLISYPLYLWHWPLLVFARLVGGDSLTAAAVATCLVSSMVLAFLTYRYVEKPIRFGAHKRRSAGFLVGGLAVMALVGAGLATVIPARIEYDPEIEPGFTSDNWIYPGGGFDNSGRLRRHVIPGDSSRTIVFIGDSHMEMYWPRFVELRRKTPGAPRMIFATEAACPLLPGARKIDWSAGQRPGECTEFLRQAFDIAQARSVETVVMSSDWERYLERPEIVFGEGGRMLSREGPDTDAAFNALRDSIIRLRNQGVRVFLILSNPADHAYSPEAIFPAWRLPGISHRISSRPLSREILERKTKATDGQLRRAARESGAEVIDPFDYMCGRTICPVVRQNGKPFYLDANHFRATAARDLTFLDQVLGPVRR